MVTQILINRGLECGLLPGSARPSPEPLLNSVPCHHLPYSFFRNISEMRCYLWKNKDIFLRLLWLLTVDDGFNDIINIFDQERHSYPWWYQVQHWQGAVGWPARGGMPQGVIHNTQIAFQRVMGGREPANRRHWSKCVFDHFSEH